MPPKKPAPKKATGKPGKKKTASKSDSAGNKAKPEESEEAVQTATIGRIEPQSITEEMQSSYLDYAMSVIVSRALPDVRDGLKPVHRRILYAMWQLGLKPGARFRKSATVVGEVLGKYHPHGDSAVYDSMVRMAQDFSMRYQLVHGQGNFGSMDGDRAAAMRYTEAKLRKISEEMISDIEKDTVDFAPNYDGSQKEPTVMPARLPNLLLNGTLGIAVGMATNIPPHNLTEICDAIIHIIENKNCTVQDLSDIVKGPDFPTGGIIYDAKAIRQAYASGKGGVVVRAKTEIVEGKGNSYRIIVSEIPFQVNKATLLEKIADLVRSKKLEGIRDLRDESNKEGVRVVIELKKDAYPKKVLNRLFNMTPLQDTFHFNMLALVDGGTQPRIMNLKAILDAYLEHRKEVVKRRTQFELTRAEERAHILKGLKKALDNLDAVIKTIKKSKDRNEARANLMKKFRLDEIQAQAILDMRLQQLANLEQKRITDELKEKMALIKDLQAILSSSSKMLTIIKNEVKELREKYGDERRTDIVKHGVKEFSAEDFVPNESTVVMVTRDGYIKRLPPDTFRTQTRGGKGVVGLATKEEDVVERLMTTTTHSDLLFFTTRGRVFQLKAYDIPKATRTAKGQALVNFLQLAPNEKVSSIYPVEDVKDAKYMVMVTSKGTIKKVELSQFESVRSSGLIAIKLKPEDSLEWVKPSTGEDDIVLVTAAGQSIRFNETDVRSMGRVASGVRGVNLKGKDEIVGMGIVGAKEVEKGLFDLMVVMNKGYGKRTNLKNYGKQGRGGSGIKTANVTDKTGRIISARVVNSKDDRDVMVMSAKGQVIRFALKTVPVLSRQTQGVRIMRFKTAGDTVSSLTLI